MKIYMYIFHQVGDSLDYFIVRLIVGCVEGYSFDVVIGCAGVGVSKPISSIPLFS